MSEPKNYAKYGVELWVEPPLENGFRPHDGYVLAGNIYGETEQEATERAHALCSHIAAQRRAKKDMYLQFQILPIVAKKDSTYCDCERDEKHGETQFFCCNERGKRTEIF